TSNNTASCNSSVTVVDTVDPVIDCGATVTVNTSSMTPPGCSATRTVSPTANDACSGARPTTCGSNTLSLSAPGTIDTTCSASDTAGHSASCTAILKLIDNTNPVVTCPAAQTAECNDGQGGA